MKVKLLPQNQAYVDRLLKDYEANVASDERRREVMMASFGDEDKAAEFAAARIVKVYLNWLANSTGLGLFELISLNANERPVLISETDQSYNVLTVQQHGAPAANDFVNKDTVNNYLLYEVQTDRVDYPIESIQTGSLQVSDRVNERLAYNLDRQINKDIWTLIDAAFGSYPSGAWEKDADIVSGTLPTTNAIDKTSEGAFTFPVIKAMADHADRLGKTIQKIIINPTEKSDLYDWPSLVDNTGGTAAKDLVTKAIRESIVSNGTVSKFFGHDFEIVLDNTRAMKYVWFFMGPAGILFDKPSMARAIRWSEKELMILAKKQRFEGVQIERVIKPLIPAPYRLNFGRVQFQS